MAHHYDTEFLGKYLVSVCYNDFILYRLSIKFEYTSCKPVASFQPHSVPRVKQRKPNLVPPFRLRAYKSTNLTRIPLCIPIRS